MCQLDNYVGVGDSPSDAYRHWQNAGNSAYPQFVTDFHGVKIYSSRPLETFASS